MLNVEKIFVYKAKYPRSLAGISTKTKYKKTQSHCVASVSARVRREQLDQSEKKGEGGGGGGGGKYLPSNAHLGGDYLTILCVSLC